MDTTDKYIDSDAGEAYAIADAMLAARDKDPRER